MSPTAPSLPPLQIIIVAHSAGEGLFPAPLRLAEFSDADSALAWVAPLDQELDWGLLIAPYAGAPALDVVGGMGLDYLKALQQEEDHRQLLISTGGTYSAPRDQQDIMSVAAHQLMSQALSRRASGGHQE